MLYISLKVVRGGGGSFYSFSCKGNQLWWIEQHKIHDRLSSKTDEIHEQSKISWARIKMNIFIVHRKSMRVSVLVCFCSRNMCVWFQKWQKEFFLRKKKSTQKQSSVEQWTTGYRNDFMQHNMCTQVEISRR